MAMRSYVEVTTQNEMDQLIELLEAFSDGLVKEVRIANRGYALDHSFVVPDSADVQVLAQAESPNQPRAIELVFIDVTKCDFKSRADCYPVTGIVKRTKLIISDIEEVQIEVTLDGSLSISAKRLFYQVRNSWLGPKDYLVSAVPSPTAIIAKAIEENWRQCSNCSDAWEEKPENKFSVCPTCRQITELH